MPTLQYPNPNRPFKLLNDVSNHSYLGILHQEETPSKPGAETKDDVLITTGLMMIPYQ